MEMITDNFTFAEILKMRKEKTTFILIFAKPQGGNKPCDAVRVRRSRLWRSRPGKIEPGMEQGYLKKTALFSCRRNWLPSPSFIRLHSPQNNDLLLKIDL
jgi:hypothetical protein